MQFTLPSSFGLPGLTLSKGGGVFSPLDLFQTGDILVWYDPSDLSTMFQDTAGTTPVTADGQSVLLIRDKGPGGYHRTQATPSQAPKYKTDGTLHWLLYDGTDDGNVTPTINWGTVTSDGAARRNLFTFPTAFDNGIWVKNNLTVAANSVSAPDGTTTADTATRDATSASENRVRFTTAQAINTVHTLSCYVRANTVGAKLQMRNLAIDAGATDGVVHFDPSDGSVSLTYGSTYTGKATMTPVGNGWYRCTITGTTPGSIANNLIDIGVTNGASAVGGTAGDSVHVWGAQLELGSTATDFQNIGSDEVAICAGVTKSSDAAGGAFAELSATSASNNGTFAMLAPASAAANYYWRSKGTGDANMTVTTYTAPTTNVLTGQGKIATDLATLRADGAQVGTSATDQGTGNFGNHILYFGRRGGSSLPFNGKEHQTVIRSRLFTTSEEAKLETFTAAKTGVIL
jgi:hypothetical protein